MISVQEAKKTILENSSELMTELVPLAKSCGRVLAEDVIAAIDIPNYPQSSMDGYAFNYNDWKEFGSLPLSGEMAAGSNREAALMPGTSVRIFTGAAVPSGADTVVMQEKTLIENGLLVIEDNNLKQGDHVRLKGAEITKGSVALKKGQQLSPAALGFLAGFGITEVLLYRNPRVKIIVTGNELQKPGLPLGYGQVYESNSFALTSALQQIGIEDIEVCQAGDQLEELTKNLAECMERSDMILLTGGVSVGDYDFTLEAAAACGIDQVFHKIKQKPGKPIYFGRKGDQLVFGLPGNPASVLTCFYEYVTIALQRMTHRSIELVKKQVPMDVKYKKGAGLTHFLKGQYDGNRVTVLDAQESFRMHSFARANCLVQINEETSICEAGEIVEVHILPV